MKLFKFQGKIKTKEEGGREPRNLLLQQWIAPGHQEPNLAK